MRQALDHPYLVTHGPAADETAIANSAAPGFYDLCACCNAQIRDAADCAVAACKHTFHRDCAAALVDVASENGEAPECPVCFRPLSLQVERVHGLAEADMDGEAPAKKKPPKKKVRRRAPPAAVDTREREREGRALVGDVRAGPAGPISHGQGPEDAGRAFRRRYSRPNSRRPGLGR